MLDLAAISKSIPPDLRRSPAPVEIQESQDRDIRVQFRFQQVLVEGKRVRYWGGVRAFYGPTILECEELILNYEDQNGQAIGKVRVTDPDGSLEAENLTFSWKDRTGVASNVRAQVANMRLRIDKLEIGPKEWIATGIRGTPSKTRPPEFEFSARKLFLRPGQSGRAVQPGLSVAGIQLGKIPRYTFSLDNRVIGFRLPAPAFRRGQGLGAGWTSSVLVSPQAAATASIGVLPKAAPSIKLEVTGSTVAAENMIGRLSTRNDLGDRFQDSWFDSIKVNSRKREPTLLRQPRQTFSLGTYWGQSVAGRPENPSTISKPFDAAVEVGFRFGSGGGLLQSRLQSIRGMQGQDYVQRVQLQTVAHSGSLPLDKQFELILRVDGNAFLSQDQAYGWLRTAGFIVFEPNQTYSLALGGLASLEAGRSHFSFDRLFSRNALHGRGFVDLGSIRASGLVKYDLDRQDWIDVEYTIAMAAGAFEPYITYRQFPRELSFGLRLRTNEFFDLLSRRKIERKGTGISPVPASKEPLSQGTP